MALGMGEVHGSEAETAT